MAEVCEGGSDVKTSDTSADDASASTKQADADKGSGDIFPSTDGQSGKPQQADDELVGATANLCLDSTQANDGPPKANPGEGAASESAEGFELPTKWEKMNPDCRNMYRITFETMKNLVDLGVCADDVIDMFEDGEGGMEELIYDCWKEFADEFGIEFDRDLHAKDKEATNDNNSAGEEKEAKVEKVLTETEQQVYDTARFAMRSFIDMKVCPHHIITYMEPEAFGQWALNTWKSIGGKFIDEDVLTEIESGLSDLSSSSSSFSSSFSSSSSSSDDDGDGEVEFLDDWDEVPCICSKRDCEARAQDG